MLFTSASMGTTVRLTCTCDGNAKSVGSRSAWV